MKNLITISIAACIIFIGAICINNHHRYDTWLENREVIEVRVQNGDTLNGISYEYKPTWMNVNEYSHLILDLNDMDSADIYAGDTIKVYAERGDK